MKILYNELKVEVFKYLNNPISLIIVNRDWYSISQDPHVRAQWLINKYGKAHALFHAVRLGNTFFTSGVIRSLLSNKAIFSRYFIQRLLLQFGNFDRKLTGFKAQYGANQINFEEMRELQSRIYSSWASNLSIPIFNQLITEAPKVLKDDRLALRGNDMELFHLLSAGTHSLSDAPQEFARNLNEIKDLILNKKFIPFPPNPKIDQENNPSECYESYINLNMIIRAILVYPDLINMWKKIGYHEICSDVNNILIRGALLILFPPNPTSNWKRPDKNAIINYLKKFIDMGFRLNDNIIKESLRLFKSKVPKVDELLLTSFKEIDPSVVITCDKFLQSINKKRKTK